jgi:hypothetical protein
MIQTYVETPYSYIDRFIEKSSDLKVITTLPYFVGHRENVNSTLWDMISSSESRLRLQVNEYEKNKKKVANFLI